MSTMKPTAKEKFIMGDTVLITKVGRKMRAKYFPKARLPMERGTVIGFSSSPTAVRVQVDGIVNPIAYHMSFWFAVNRRETKRKLKLAMIGEM